MRDRPPGEEGWASPELAWPLAQDCQAARPGDLTGVMPCTDQDFHLFQIQGEDFCERNRGASRNPRGGFPRGWHPDNYPQPGFISISGVTRSPVSVSASLHLFLLGVNPLPLPSIQADGAAPNVSSALRPQPQTLRDPGSQSPSGTLRIPDSWVGQPGSRGRWALLFSQPHGGEQSRQDLALASPRAAWGSTAEEGGL